MEIVRKCGGEGCSFGAKARLPEADRDEAGCGSVVDLVEREVPFGADKHY